MRELFCEVFVLWMGFIDGWWQCVLSDIGSFGFYFIFCNYMKWMSIWFLISIVLKVFMVAFFLVTTTYHEVEYIIDSIWQICWFIANVSLAQVFFAQIFVFSNFKFKNWAFYLSTCLFGWTGYLIWFTFLLNVRLMKSHKGSKLACVNSTCQCQLVCLREMSGSEFVLGARRALARTRGFFSNVSTIAWLECVVAWCWIVPC
jgi:hypothetical protein